MSESIIQDYCRLVTSDTDACMALFHADAVLVTRIGSEPVEVTGERKIRAFLDMTPRFLKYSVTGVEEKGGLHIAVVRVEGAHRKDDHFRFFFDDGLIRRLEIEVGESRKRK